LNCTLFMNNSGSFLPYSNKTVNRSVADNFVLVGLTQGLHRWFIECFDENGSNSMTPIQYTTIDTTLPIINLYTIPNSSTNSDLYVSGYYNDSNIDWIKVNGQIANLDRTSRYFYKTLFLFEGNNSISVTAKDFAGNFYTINSSVIVDSNDPEINNVNFISPWNLNYQNISGYYYESNVNSIKFFVYNESSMLIDFQNAMIDGTAMTFWANVTLDNGWNDVVIMITDTFNNSYFQDYYIMVDNSPPFLGFTFPPNNSIFHENISYVYARIFDFPGGVDFNSSNISVEGVNGTLFTNNYQDMVRFNPTNTLGPGNYTIRIYAQDFMNNSANFTTYFKIKENAPEIAIYFPGYGHFTNQDNIYLTGDIFYRGYPGTATLYVNGAFQTSLPDNFNVMVNLTEGFNYLDINATNNLSVSGNKRVTVFYEQEPPQMIPEYENQTTNQNISNVSIQLYDDMGVNLTDSRIVVQGVNHEYDCVSGDDGINTITCDFGTNVPDDVYVVEVNALDYAGNEETYRYRFYVDHTPPFIDLLYPENNSIITSNFNIDIIVKDINLKAAYYSHENITRKFNSSRLNIDTSSWSEGPNNFTIFAKDDAGNNATKFFNIWINDTIIHKKNQSINKFDRIIEYLNDSIQNITSNISVKEDAMNRMGLNEIMTDKLNELLILKQNYEENITLADTDTIDNIITGLQGEINDFKNEAPMDIEIHDRQSNISINLSDNRIDGIFGNDTVFDSILINIGNDSLDNAQRNRFRELIKLI